MDILYIFFSFRGRIGRREYWSAAFKFAVVFAVAGMVIEYVAKEHVWIACFIMFSLFWPAFAIQTKRWHDRNKSGWWNLIILIPIVGYIWASIELGFIKGTPGENRYDLPAYTKDSYIAERIRESRPLRDGASVRNSWRDS
jgi:uncharacterized membrane protein YhaH (DUF805 family)